MAANATKTPEQERFLDTADASFLTPELLRSQIEEEPLLLYAVKNLMVKSVEVLLKAGANFDEANKKGVTPLSVAATKGCTEIIEPLIRYGAKVDMINNSGSTALIQASHFGHVAAVEMLIQRGADADKENNKGTTALMRASQEGHVEISRLLIAKGANVNKKNLEGMNALMLASQRGHAGMARLLTAAGAQYNEQTTQGSTALMLACKRGHDKVVEVLVSVGAEIFIRDRRNRTARDTALRRDHSSLLKWLDTSMQRDQMQASACRERSVVLKQIHRQHARGELGLATVPQRAAALYEQHILQPGSLSMVPLTQADAEAVAHLSARITLNDAERPLPASRPRKGYAEWQWHYVLLKCLNLPEGLFTHICMFIPKPRIWQTQLKALKQRCKLAPRQAISDTSAIIDEILADANIFAGPNQNLLLVKTAHNPQLHDYLENGLGIKRNTIDTMIANSDVQSLAARTSDNDVKFMPPVARKLLACAVTLWKWQRTRSCSGRAMGLSSDDADAQAAMGMTARESDGDAIMSVEETPNDHDTESEIPNDGDLYEDEGHHNEEEEQQQYDPASEAEAEDEDEENEDEDTNDLSVDGEDIMFN